MILFIFWCIFGFILEGHYVAASTCYQDFSVIFENSSRVSFSGTDGDKTCILVLSVNEVESVGHMLYSVSWTDDLETPPYIDNTDPNTALEYITNTTGNKVITFSVSNSMEGLVDYNNIEDRKTTLDLMVYFDFVLSSNHVLQIQHIIVDANTAAPFFEEDSYSFNIIETYPSDYTISGLSLNAYDFDADSPNNEFEVITDDDCPLYSGVFTSLEGLPAGVTFMLKERLDYDSMDEPRQYECNVTLQDKGTPQLQSLPYTLILMLDPYPDEKPVLTSQFYSGTLQGTTAYSTVIVEPEIMAMDKDVPPSVVSYSMKPTNLIIMADYYFSIDSTTGVITLIQDINEAVRSWGLITFALSACDENNQCDKALLTIDVSIEEPEEIHFDQPVYNADFLIGYPDMQLTVHAESTKRNPVIYEFIQNNSPGIFDFEIKRATGVIYDVGLASPDLYMMVVKASTRNAAAVTTVYINVIEPLGNETMIEESVISLTINEDYLGALYQVQAERTLTYCIMGAIPNFYGIQFEVSSTGVVNLTMKIDAEMDQTVLVKIRATDVYYDCSVSMIMDTHLLRNEVFLELSILDVNEYVPDIYDASLYAADYTYYGYPTEEDLQKAMKSLTTVKVDDIDITKAYTYSIKYYDDDPRSFEIDSNSGEIFYVGGSVETSFTIVVTDSNFTNQQNVIVLKLDKDRDIHTVRLENVRLDGIEQKISDIGYYTYVYLYLLYWDLSEEYSTGGSDVWNISAHVYAISPGLNRTLTTEELNGFLQNSTTVSNVVARPFDDALYFASYTDETKSFKIATYTLAGIIGFIILLAVIFGAFKGYKAFSRHHAKKKYKTGTRDDESRREERVNTVLEDSTTNTDHENSDGNSSSPKRENRRVSFDEPGTGQTQSVNTVLEDSTTNTDHENSDGNSSSPQRENRRVSFDEPGTGQTQSPN